MSLAGDLREWNIRLVALLKEGEELERRVEELEKQNSFLRRQLSPDAMKSDGMEALSALYDEGFHICHANFARSREDEDCLFCLSFLYKEGLHK